MVNVVVYLFRHMFKKNKASRSESQEIQNGYLMFTKILFILKLKKKTNRSSYKATV